MDFSGRVIVIVGPTASGKTAAAIELAKRYQGEVICADSRTVYKGLDIGTAKPTASEMEGVPHFGLDLVLPSERYSALDFKLYAEQKIIEIQARGHLPIVVGGTGLYIDALLYDYSFGAPPDEKMREYLNEMSIQELQEYCHSNNIKLPENHTNKRYLVRSIENSQHETARKSEPDSKYIVVGISTDKTVLLDRIAQRFDVMLQNGVVHEATSAIQQYGVDAPGLNGNIYRLIGRCGIDNIDMADLRAKFITLDWHLVKRQRTWFARNKCIHWCDLSQIVPYIETQLAKRPKI